MNAKYTLPELDGFQSAYGRHCTLAAQALNEHPREAVRAAFAGRPAPEGLRALRLQRIEVNHRTEIARHALARAGLANRRDVTLLLLKIARQSRDAVEAEWACAIPTTPLP